MTGSLSYRDATLLAALLALCLALRVIQITGLPMFVDESLYTHAAQIVGAHPASTALFTMESPTYGGNPPLFSWLAAPLTRLVPDPLLAARLASALIGTLGALATWAIGRTLWGAGAGLVAGLLYTCCPFILFYNRLAVLDGLVATCGAGALFFAIGLARHARWRDAVALGLCLAAGLLTKILAVSLLLLPVLAVLATHPATRRRARSRAAIAVAIGVLPFTCVLLRPYGNTVASFALHGHLELSGGVDGVLGRLWSQAACWASGLWLYLTPPVLLLGALGLWSLRQERLVLLVGAWTLLGSLPVVLAPNRFFVPRHFLYIAVPAVVLGTRGLLLLAAWARARLPAHAALWLLPCGLSLLALPAFGADAAIIGAPARTPLIAADRFQYVMGWPSGYMLAPVVSYLRRQVGDGTVTVVSEASDPPLSMLQIALYRDRDIAVTAAAFATAEPLRAILARAARRGHVYVIAHHSSDRPWSEQQSLLSGLSSLAAQGMLRLVMEARSLDGRSNYVVYAVRRS